jgi:hypothetical protein
MYSNEKITKRYKAYKEADSSRCFPVLSFWQYLQQDQYICIDIKKIKMILGMIMLNQLKLQMILKMLFVIAQPYDTEDSEPALKIYREMTGAVEGYEEANGNV